MTDEPLTTQAKLPEKWIKYNLEDVHDGVTVLVWPHALHVDHERRLWINTGCSIISLPPVIDHLEVTPAAGRRAYLVRLISYGGEGTCWTPENLAMPLAPVLEFTVKLMEDPVPASFPWSPVCNCSSYRTSKECPVHGSVPGASLPECGCRSGDF